MTEQERTNKDALTGIYNYQTFLTRFNEQIAKVNQEGGCVSLAFVDIDYFKKINDENGHKVGDEVLKTLAKHLTNSISNNGIVFRYGGEEFVILLPAIEKEQAFLLLESVRSSFDKDRDYVADTKKARLKVTFSVGISLYPEDGNRADDIIRKADEALYRSKTSGRNKICLSREEKMVTKTSHYTQGQLERLAQLAKKEGVGEAVLLREALDDLFRKYLVYEVNNQ